LISVRPSAAAWRAIHVVWWLAAGLLCLTGGCATRDPQSHFTAAALRHSEQAAVIRGLRGFPPAGPEAEFSALATVIRYWGPRVTPTDLQTRHAQLRLRAQTAEEQVSLLTRPYGLWTRATALSVDRLKAALRAGAPVIVARRLGPPDSSGRRFTVAAGYDDTIRQFLVFDGGARADVMPENEFLEQWSAQHFRAFVICPPDRPPWPPDAGDLFSRGRFYEETGDPRRARRDYEGALAGGQRTPAVYTGLANVCRRLANPARAEELYRTAIAQDPQYGQAYNNLAWLLAENRDRPEEAVRLARQAVLLAPANPRYLDTLGFALAQAGQEKEAADVLERARGKAVHYPAAEQVEIGLRLARVQLALGQPHLARQVLDDLRQLDPQFRVPPDIRALLETPVP